jgi:hypothetical protein
MPIRKEEAMKTQDPRTGRSVLVAFLLTGTWLFGGCGILDEGDPTSARVVIEGGEGHPIQLVTTHYFLITTDQDGENREIYVTSADTSAVTSPFDRKYDLGPRKRFYATVSSAEIAPTPVSVKVYVDGDLRFNRSTFFGEEVLEFVFSVR